MGQYHEIWAFATDGSPAEHVDHYAFGAGAKLGEQAHEDSTYAAVIGLLALGRWKGRKLIVIGDYADATDVADFAEEATLDRYYGASDTATREQYPDDFAGSPRNVIDVSEDAKAMLAEAAGITYSLEGRSSWAAVVRPDDWDERAARWRSMGAGATPHVIQSSRGEYIRPEAFGSPVHPFAMPMLGAAWSMVIGLLACSDGRGGGDLCLSKVGRWAYSTLDMRTADTAHGTDITDWCLTQDRVRTWVMEGMTV